MIAYVYDIDTSIVIAKISGDNTEDILDVYADKIGDQEDLSFTYLPHFDMINGLIDNSECVTYIAKNKYNKS